MLAFLGLATSMQAVETEELSLKGWDGGWNATNEYEDGILTITLTGGYGAGGCHFATPQDWSSYRSLTIVVESHNGGWGQVIINDGISAEDGGKSATVSLGQATEKTRLIFDLSSLDADLTKNVANLCLQSAAVGNVIKVSEIYLTKAAIGEYDADGVELSINEYGAIPASEFEGFSGDAKVVFTYETTGNTLTADGESSVVNWGCGNLTSFTNADDKSLKIRDIVVESIGEHSFAYYLSDISFALEYEGQYGKGLMWNFWKQGQAENTRISVKVYELQSTSTPVAENASDAEVVATEYYSVAGVTSVTPQKGINIIKDTLSDGTVRTRKVIVK